MSGHRLRVDWPECQGRGLCHELAPEVVQLDPWGYPIITGPVEDDTLAAAREAVAGCPRRAIRLEKT